MGFLQRFIAKHFITTITKANCIKILIAKAKLQITNYITHFTLPNYIQINSFKGFNSFNFTLLFIP